MMKRYKRIWVRIDRSIYQFNAYKNDDGDVFISFKGEWKNVDKKSVHDWYWVIV